MHIRADAGKRADSHPRVRRVKLQAIDFSGVEGAAQGLASVLGSGCWQASPAGVRSLSTELSTQMVDSWGNCRCVKGLQWIVRNALKRKGRFRFCTACSHRETAGIGVPPGSR